MGSNAHRLLVGELEAKRKTPTEEYEYEMDRGKAGWGGIIWTDMTAVEGSCEHGNEPRGVAQSVEKFVSVGTTSRPLDKDSAPGSCLMDRQLVLEIMTITAHTN
jgi:hypothetical protein